ncbi:MAG: hypothetical protein KJ952_02335 [Candidatus Omnitrophica bacterium]|nr:hypothetical protein [Candidatus Omnitrophota bacterium]
MIYWVPFLHFYQPSIQYHTVLKKICNESYRPLVDMFLKHPNAKVTINICGSLTDLLSEHGAQDVLDGLKRLAQKKQLEFVDTAKYHAILPLIPKHEIQEQIRLNHKTNSHFFKEVYKTRGFFPPEMCYSDEVAGILKIMQYDWVLVSGIACQSEWPLDYISSVSCDSSYIKIFFRDDIISNKISFHNTNSVAFIKDLVNLSKGKRDIYVITAMDAETFGHHIRNWEKTFLADVYETIDGLKRKSKKTLPRACKKIISELREIPQIDVLTMSEILERFPIRKTKPALASSWSTSKDEVLKGNYYPLWKDPSNFIHKLQWRCLNICFELVEKVVHLRSNNKEVSRFSALARTYLDKAVFSCQFWWANKSRGTWDINLINKGLMLQEEVLLNVHKAINLSIASDKTKKDFYRKIFLFRRLANRVRDMLATG